MAKTLAELTLEVEDLEDLVAQLVSGIDPVVVDLLRRRAAATLTLQDRVQLARAIMLTRVGTKKKLITHQDAGE
jgi:hypothetical protein